MDLPMNKAINKIKMKTTDDKNHQALANVTFKIIQIAFADLSPGLTNEFKSLCAVDNPVTSKHFGDDLDKQIKEIKE